MGQKVIRVGVDATQGHPPASFAPTLAVAGSPNVFAEKIAVVRQGDAFAPHVNKKGDVHTGNAVGGGSVYANGKLLQRMNDKLTCGDTSLNGAGTVFAG